MLLSCMILYMCYCQHGSNGTVVRLALDCMNLSIYYFDYGVLGLSAIIVPHTHTLHGLDKVWI